jgi:hypothetical protein
VQVVAHRYALRGDSEQVHRAGPLDDLCDGRPAGLGEEAQPGDRGVGLAAEPGDLAGTLVERGERAATALAVVDHHDGGGRTDRAGHRHDGVVVVGRVERDVAALQQPLRLRDVGGPTLGDHRGAHRAAQRVTHLRVGQRGAAVQQHAARHAGDRGRDRGHRGQLRDALVEPADDLGVRLVDRGAGVCIELGEGRDGVRVTAGGDAPIHVFDGPALRAYRVGEHRQADVDDRDLVRQHELRHSGPLPVG